MSEGLSLDLAWRLMTHTSNGFARFVTWVSFLGLTLGVMILTLVVTVMNGFDDELKKRLLSSVPHITVPHAQVTQALEDAIATHRLVRSSTEYFRGLGAVMVRSRVFPVTIYGASFEHTNAETFAGLSTQSIDALRSDPNGIVLGAPLARAMGLTLGEDLPLMTAQVSDSAVSPKIVKYRLVGTFELGAEPDYTLAVISLARFAATQWLSLGELGLQVQLHDPLQADSVLRDLTLVQPQTIFRSWQSEYGELFQAVQLEKSMMFVLLLLVVAIAAFNIIAGQSMLVNDKRRSIAILRTMGCSQKLIRQVFLIQGSMVGLSGTILGLALGLLAALFVNDILALAEQISGMHLLDGSLFVEVPILIMYSDMALIAVLSFGLCLLSAWVPASKAAAMDPIAALH